MAADNNKEGPAHCVVRLPKGNPYSEAVKTALEKYKEEAGNITRILEVFNVMGALKVIASCDKDVALALKPFFEYVAGSQLPEDYKNDPTVKAIHGSILNLAQTGLGYADSSTGGSEAPAL